MLTKISTSRFQRGIALLPVVVVLMLLTLLALASLRGATLLERMAGNERDLMVAQQAAEAALRDAERDMDGRRADGTPVAVCPVQTSSCRSDDMRPNNPDFYTLAVPFTCQFGMCYAPLTTNGAGYFATPVWVDPAQQANAATYGQFTNATPILGLAAQPTYWIEALGYNSQAQSVGAPNNVMYRITARAVGRSAGTVVYLQSIYDPAQ